MGVIRCADSWQLHLTHCLCTLKAKDECLLGLNSSVSLESMSQAFSNSHVHLDKAEGKSSAVTYLGWYPQKATGLAW
jgi:hypothetical protein